MIIEPCCVHMQLPQHLVQNKWHLTLFQTNGDVTFPKILDSIAYLVGRGGCTLKLVLPQEDPEILKHLKWYHSRGWLRHLTLCIYPGTPTLLLEGSEGEILLTGPLPSTPSPTPVRTLYTAYFGSSAHKYAPELQSLLRQHGKDITL